MGAFSLIVVINLLNSFEKMSFLKASVLRHSICFNKIAINITRGSKESKVMIRAKEIKNPDHLGQRTTFPPFYGSGYPKLTDMDKIRRIRSPTLGRKSIRREKFLKSLKEHLAVEDNIPLSQNLSHCYVGNDEIVQDMKVFEGVGLNEQNLSSEEVLENVAQEAKKPQRLFAVISFGGGVRSRVRRSTQFKVTTEDIFVHQGECEAKCGDRIKIEKVLLAGGKDFTLLGMPLLKRGLVNVEATLIEKTFSHMEFWQEFSRDPKYFTPYQGSTRHPYHVFRINSISINPELI